MLKNALQNSIGLAYFELGSFDPTKSAYGHVSSYLVYGRILSAKPNGDLQINVYDQRYQVALIDSEYLRIDGNKISYRNSTEEEFFQFGLIHNLYDLEYSDLTYIRNQYQQIYEIAAPTITRAIYSDKMRNDYINAQLSITQQYVSTAETQEALKRLFVMQGGNPDDIFPRTK